MKWPSAYFDASSLEMLGFIAKKLQLSSASSTNGFKAFSTVLKSDCKGDAFTHSYLVNSCGVAVDAANKISNRLRLESADKPTQTVNFLRKYGFDDEQISSIVTVAPNVLVSHPVKTLKPKFDVLRSLGASHEAMCKIILNGPKILQCMSLKARIVPALDLIKSIVRTKKAVITLLTRFRIFHNNPLTTLGPNVAFLRDIGMSEKSLGKFLMYYGNAFRHEPVKFKAMVDRALGMGFDVEMMNFGNAINSFAALNEEKWEKKVKIFQKWGWSESEFNLAFRKQPRIMLTSEAKLEGVMDYMVNEMGVDAKLLAKNPYAIQLSLKKRIIPRCSVVKVLLSKDLIEKDLSLNSFLICTDEYFLKAYVEKHAAVSSELLALYSSFKQ